MSELKQKILKHELSEAGFPDSEYRGVPGRMFIDRKNDRMPDINDAGDIHYGTEYNHMAIHTIRPVVDRVNEVVAAWELSHRHNVKDASKYRIIAEYNDVVLAARDDTELGRGFNFVTWKYSQDHTGFDHGNYTTDYAAAKEDFAVRSGLIPRTKVFDKEQAVEIRNAIMYCLENDGDMTMNAEEQLRSIAARLTDGYSLADPADIPSQPEIQATQAINGALNIGDWVIAAPSDEYGYLLGTVTAIDKLGTPEHGTDNTGDDIHVDFYAFDYPPERIAEIEEAFSDLYGEPKTFDELPIDDVIMAPDTLIRITELGHDEITRMGNLLQNCEAFCNCFPGAGEPQTDLHANLMARLESNLADYHNSLMNFGKREIIDMAGKIAAMKDVHNYMTTTRGFDDDEIQFYLKFQSPLEVVADAWLERNADNEDLCFTLDFLFDKKDALVDYPLMSDLTAPADKTAEKPAQAVAPSEPSTRKPKRSLGDKLNAAGEKVKAQNAQDNKKESHKRDERS